MRERIDFAAAMPISQGQIAQSGGIRPVRCNQVDTADAEKDVIEPCANPIRREPGGVSALPNQAVASPSARLCCKGAGSSQTPSFISTASGVRQAVTFRDLAH